MARVSRSYTLSPMLEVLPPVQSDQSFRLMSIKDGITAKSFSLNEADYHCAKTAKVNVFTKPRLYQLLPKTNLFGLYFEDDSGKSYLYDIAIPAGVGHIIAQDFHVPFQSYLNQINYRPLPPYFFIIDGSVGFPFDLLGFVPESQPELPEPLLRRLNGSYDKRDRNADYLQDPATVRMNVPGTDVDAKSPRRKLANPVAMLSWAIYAAKAALITDTRSRRLDQSKRKFLLLGCINVSKGNWQVLVSETTHLA